MVGHVELIIVLLVLSSKHYFLCGSRVSAWVVDVGSILRPLVWAKVPGSKVQVLRLLVSSARHLNVVAVPHLGQITSLNIANPLWSSHCLIEVTSRGSMVVTHIYVIVLLERRRLMNWRSSSLGVFLISLGSPPSIKGGIARFFPGWLLDSVRSVK